jgi:hypothetical protein
VQPETLAEGTSLDGRYRLEQLVGAGDGCALWRAVDTVLSRSVAVRTLGAESPHADAVLSAARAASVVGDPRLVRILDASRSEGVVYVVAEWVEGLTLAEMLASGPLEPADAAFIVGEVAEAVSTAHRLEVPHLRLHPYNVLRSRSGEIRVSGLGVSAALAGVESLDPARDDARGLGALLYACLTARWPGQESYGLAPAPTEDDRVCTPRQVLAGVSSRLDAVTEQAMQDEPRRGGEPLRSPGEVAAALADVPRTAPVHATMALPMPTPEQLQPGSNGRDATDDWSSPSWSPPSYGEPSPAARPRRRAAAPREQSPGTTLARRVLVAVVVIAVLVAVFAYVLDAVRPDRSAQPSGSPSATASASPTPHVLPVASVSDFDPEGDGSEHPSEVKLATDGDPQLRGATTEGRSASDYTTLDRAAGAGTSLTLKPKKPTHERYLLLWLTKLPASGGNYRGGIDEVTVHGRG